MRRLPLPAAIVIALATLIGSSVAGGPATASTPQRIHVAAAGAVRLNHRTGLPVGTLPTHGQLARAARTDAGVQQAATAQTATAPQYHLTNYGGPVVSNIQVQPVQWGSGSYIPQISSTTAPSMQSFFGSITSAPYLGQLSQYSTATQTIGAGSVSSPITITPSVGTPNTTVSDGEIRQELVDQIFNEPGGPLYQGTAGAAALTNTTYVLYFPATVTICQDSAEQYCSYNTFCGYHSSFTAVDPSQTPIANVRYVVLPDPDSHWVGGCSSNNATTPFTALQSVASHELSEVITDPEPQQNLAWYDADPADPTGAHDPGEIADICEMTQWPSQDTSYIGSDGQPYILQNVWSNLQNACVPRIAASITSAPGAFSLGNSATFHFGVTGASTSSGTTYDVAYKAAAWNGSWGPRTTLVSRTSATAASLRLRAGTEYCVVVRAHDSLGLVSRWSTPRCTTAPLDDRSLTEKTTGWSRTTPVSAYHRTVTRSGRSGAELQITGANANRLALVVTTCPTCGNVQIWLGSSLWKTVSTKSSTVRYQHVAVPGTFSMRRTTITIRIGSGLGIIDGLGVMRAAPSF